MSTYVKNPVLVSAVFLWIGSVAAISFMEAWLKFQAPGVTLAIGLGIGRLVFGVLNKVEWVFAFTILIVIIGGERRVNWQNALFLISILVLVVQTFWLLPELDARADLVMQEQAVAPSNLHLYYVSAEVLKVIALSIFGFTQFRYEPKKITDELQQKINTL